MPHQSRATSVTTRTASLVMESLHSTETRARVWTVGTHVQAHRNLWHKHKASWETPFAFSEQTSGVLGMFRDFQGGR